MKAYYRELFAKATELTKPWFGSKLAWLGSGLTTVFGLLLCASTQGVPSAVDEFVVYALFGVGGFSLAWAFVFAVNAARAPWLLHKELSGKLEEKESRTSAEKWRALRAEFAELGEHAYDQLSLNWNKEGTIDHGWHFRGAPQLIPHFEPLARRGAKLVRRSPYCRKNLSAHVMSYQDDVRLWAEAIRGLTGAFKMSDRIMWSEDENGKRCYYQSGSIDQVIQASGLFCLELESQEDDA